uniref:Reverse transcriptase domain-containing protein n=1 Tax=Loa loa TaxID=7209 RepID=A0A1I7V5G5_LOALO
MVDDNKGLLNLINNDQVAIISLEVYKDEFELVPQRLQQSKINIEPSQLKEPSQMFQQTVNLTQLPLLTFSGDQKLWREFCSSFDAAVHLQKIPDIQKLNYLILCLKENALQAVKGYDIAPENYDVIRKVLVKKIGNLSTIKKLLYNELYSIKGHDREWKTTVESMERILDNWKQWVSVWSIQASKLLSKRNGEVQRSQASSNGYQRKSIESKSSHNPRSARGETSALAAIKQPKPNDSKRITNSRKYPGNNKIQRPCSFYNEDHWKDECQVYQTANQRLNCLQKGHIQSSQDTRSEKLREEKLESTMMTTHKKATHSSAGDERLSIASFGNKLPKKWNSTKAEVGIRIGKMGIITYEVNVMEYLTNKLEMVTVDDKNISSIMERKNLKGIDGYWKQPEIFIGVKDFFKFIKLDAAQELESGFLLLRAKLGPMLAGMVI